MQASGRNMYVFRDGRRSAPGRSLVEALAAGVRALWPTLSLQNQERQGWGTQWAARGTRARSAIIDTLLRAGELECALADVGSPESGRLAQLTDILARLLVDTPASTSFFQQQHGITLEGLISLLPRAVPATLGFSPPEGFVYYALHPLDFADLAGRADVSGNDAAVIGIRSIGTTLSALVAAGLRKRGVRAERITVRPAGHPYDRHTEFDAAQLRWIAGQRARAAEFLVVDEGPGMSGSSFLSVGEALADAGVAHERIQFLCSRQSEAANLCARDAAERWGRFRVLCAAPASRLPASGPVYIGGGYWRHQLIGQDPALWPASWSQMERLKYLSSDGRTLFKFQGFGRFGEEISERARVLSEARYSSPCQESVEGFGCYPFVEGNVLRAGDLDREVLERMAAYCAFRAQAFRSAETADTASLKTMVRFNLSEEFGYEWKGDLAELCPEVPVLVDGRMLPHELVRARDGRLLKCDATSHGDDHFFPGPATDIAWDLAGAIVEWNMTPEAAACFLERYHHASGDDARRRLPAFQLAYSVFRFAYSKMAACAMRGSEEEPRLLAAYRYYRQRAAALLPQAVPMAA